MLLGVRPPAARSSTDYLLSFFKKINNFFSLSANSPNIPPPPGSGTERDKNIFQRKRRRGKGGEDKRPESSRNSLLGNFIKSNMFTRLAQDCGLQQLHPRIASSQSSACY